MKNSGSPEWEDMFVFPIENPKATKIRIILEDVGEDEGGGMGTYYFLVLVPC